MKNRRRIYEGKAKILYEGPEPGTLIQFFKDDATAFNKKKHEVVDGKGVLNNRISEHIFNHLNRMGIPTHFIRRLNMREQLIREVEIIPLEVVVRNIAAGSLPVPGIRSAPQRDRAGAGQVAGGERLARPRAGPRSSPTRAPPTAISGRPHEPMEIHA